VSTSAAPPALTSVLEAGTTVATPTVSLPPVTVPVVPTTSIPH
jgi:hypothetical protein